eukprot:gb/GECG01006971.1/.p1 GENE.gb/GECG01006971.1/~~gb/GECG01006971.1/.p1  ORF type:complete len:659 (+),score=53.28 gb/GECG01006971.1/:1-1977(+)
MNILGLGLQKCDHADKRVHSGFVERSPTVDCGDSMEEHHYDIVIAGDDTAAGRSAVQTLAAFLESPELKHLKVLRVSQVEDSSEFPIIDKWNASVVGVDTDHKAIFTNDNRIIRYDKALLVPKISRISHDFLETIAHPLAHHRVKCYDPQAPLDNIAHYKRPHVTVVGNGFEALELASSVRRVSKRAQVALVCGNAGLLSEYVPRYIWKQAKDMLRKEGCRLKNFSSLQYVAPLTLDEADTNGKLQIQVCRTFNRLETSNFDTNLLYLAPSARRYPLHFGSEGASGWKNSLAMDKDSGGIHVNPELMPCADCYVAGEAACFHNAGTGKRTSYSLEHSTITGLIAASNLFGARLRYSHLPASQFRLDAFGVRVFTVGVISSKLKTIAVWIPRRLLGNGERRRSVALSQISVEHDVGIVYYMDSSNRIVGAMLWEPIADEESTVDSSKVLSRMRTLIYSTAYNPFEEPLSNNCAFTTILCTSMSLFGDMILHRRFEEHAGLLYQLNLLLCQSFETLEGKGGEHGLETLSPHYILKYLRRLARGDQLPFTDNGSQTEFLQTIEEITEAIKVRKTDGDLTGSRTNEQSDPAGDELAPATHRLHPDIAKAKRLLARVEGWQNDRTNHERHFDLEDSIPTLFAGTKLRQGSTSKLAKSEAYRRV